MFLCPTFSALCGLWKTQSMCPYCLWICLKPFLIRTKFEKDLFTYCVDNGVFQSLQDTPESSNDNTNVVNAPREPSVVDQDPGVNISQDPPQIDHNCNSCKTSFKPSESDDFSLGECDLFDIDDSYYEKSTSRLAHLALLSPEIVEVCVDDVD
ncbi:hypothetical protein Tco_0690307 [Tanacetum coccineum]